MTGSLSVPPAQPRNLIFLYDLLRDHPTVRPHPCPTVLLFSFKAEKMLQAGIVHKAFPADAEVIFREALKQRIEKLLKGAEKPFDRQLVRAARAVVVTCAPPSDLPDQRVASVRAPLKRITLQPALAIYTKCAVSISVIIKNTVLFGRDS